MFIEIKVKELERSSDLYFVWVLFHRTLLSELQYIIASDSDMLRVKIVVIMGRVSQIPINCL